MTEAQGWLVIGCLFSIIYFLQERKDHNLSLYLFLFVSVLSFVKAIIGFGS